MKKKLISLMAITVLFMTGCGNKTLKCTYTQENDGYDIKSTYQITFDSDEVSKLTMQSEIALDDDYKTYIESYEESAAEVATEYNEIEGFKATTASKNNTVTLKVVATASKMSEEDISSYSMDLTYDELKETLETEGYTCK